MSINLVLSGGGARGIAHLGIIKVLQECGIQINKISGVSSGAVIGAFIAAGYEPEAVLKIFIENKLLYKIRPLFNAGLFKITKWEEILLRCFPENSFEKLKIPLTINATDINSCKSIYFSSGPLVLPLLASCSLPGIFQPILINEHQLVDGGVLNNLPVEPFLKKKEKIIALHVNPLLFEKHIYSTFKILERSVQISITEHVMRQKDHAFIFIEPAELVKYNIYDLAAAEAIYEIGYRHASGMKSEFEALRSYD